MATYHDIVADLSPGVRVISIVVQNALGTFTPQTRAKAGDIVRFVVTPYNDFNVNSVSVYYADEYDDTVSVSYTSVVGADNTYDFIMPDTTVYVRGEAVGNVVTGIINLDNSIYNVPGNTLVYSSNYSFGGVYTKINEVISSEFNLSLDASVYDWLVLRVPVTGYYYVRIAKYAADRTISIVTQDVNFGTYNLPIGARTYIQTYVNGIIVNGTIYAGNEIDTLVRSAPPIFGYYVDGDAGYVSAINGTLTAQGLNTASIRYILSPENSGEVNGPETYTDTSFTFTYRIKAAYEFKRIRAFAIGEATGTPPIAPEVAISDVTETYDGDTRTYTFTVSSIPDWAIGVRCVIETIYLPNDENASGTNASDGPTGGNGTFDDTSDEVPLPAIPTGVSAADSGFVTLFRPTITQLKDLGNYLWSNLDEFWENLQKIFTNPMDYIIGLNIFPVSPAVGSNKSIYIGNWLTNISMPPVNNQFYEFDCGIRTIDEYFGSSLDYGPNTTARIMLPFIGDRDLAVNEIMGKTLHLWYRINLLSGECLAALTINNSTYYQWNGNCAIPIPVTGSDWSRLYGGIGRMAGAGIGLALGGLVGMGIGGAMGAMATAGNDTHYVPFTGVDNQAHYQRVGPHTPYDRASQLAPEPIREPREEFGLSRPARAALAASTASLIGHNIMGSTPRVAHSGDMSGGMSIMGNRTPYIVLEYPNVDLPDNYKHLYGYPSNQYAVLGNLSGYTECKAVMFESTTATDDEAELIIRTLKSGVYL